MTATLALLATYLVHSTVLLGAAALLTATVVRRDAWRETLWKVALLGGLLTAPLQLALGVRPLVGHWDLPENVLFASATRLPAWPRLEGPSGPGPGRELPGLSGPSAPAPQRRAIAAPAPPSPIAPAASLPPWPVWVLAGLGVVSAWGLGRLLFQRVHLRYRLRGRREVAEPDLIVMLGQLRHGAGVWRLVRLTTAPGCPSPFAFGRAEICLPPGLAEKLTPSEQRSALAHELGHIARQDPGWRLVASLVQGVCFFQPLNRLAARRLHEVSEFLADDWAVRQTGSPMELARCLAVVASHAGPGRPPMHGAAPAMAEGGSALLRRVQRLLEPGPVAAAPRAWARTSVVLAILAVAVLAAPGITPGRNGWRAEALPRGDGGALRINRYADPTQPLAARFAGTLARAQRLGHRDAWIGYEARSVVPPGTEYGSDSRSLPGRPAEMSARRVVLRSTRDRTHAQAACDLLVLLRVHLEPNGRFTVQRVAGRSPDLEIDLDGLPVYWLDAARDSESVDLLAALGRRAADPRIREKLVSLVALHRDPAAVLPRLQEVIDGGDLTRVRAAAAEGLAWQGTPVAVHRLLRTALTDRSTKVRDEAAEALGRSGTREAFAALDEIIHTPAVPVEVRAEAVEALGGFRKTETLRKLVGIAFGSFEPAIQHEAVETVADLELPGVLPVLDQVAFEHPDPRVRREAVRPLARLGQPASLEILFRVAVAGPDTRVQLQATELIADFRPADAAALLSRIVWEHAGGPVPSLAVQLIGALPAELALPALGEVAARHPNPELREEALAVITRGEWGGAPNAQSDGPARPSVENLDADTR